VDGFIQQWDVDHDGAISREELGKATGSRLSKVVDTLFQAVDKNRDGRLDTNELNGLAEMTQWTAQLLIGLWMLGVSVSMMLVERSRNRSGHRLFKSEFIMMPYWLIYLLFLVLGISIVASAIVKQWVVLGTAVTISAITR
jgi:EF hand